MFLVNLEPRKMMGELSEGMLFDIGYADGINLKDISILVIVYIMAILARNVRF